MRLGFEDQGPPFGRDLRAKARTGDSAADDDDVEIAHFTAGYELESPAV
jgi:hypothetical protein